jgi:hypothetical protein
MNLGLTWRTRSGVVTATTQHPRAARDLARRSHRRDRQQKNCQNRCKVGSERHNQSVLLAVKTAWLKTTFAVLSCLVAKGLPILNNTFRVVSR